MQRAEWLLREVLTEMVQIKAWIAANSRAIDKIYNVDMENFRRKATHHEWISTSAGLTSSLRHDQISP